MFFYRQKCIARQCPRLNQRFSVEDTEDIELESNETENHVEATKSDGDIGDKGDVGHQVEANINVKNALPQNVQRIIEKRKPVEGNMGPKCPRYACKKCGKLFLQYTSSLKHCKDGKRQEADAVCKICGKVVKLKRNLKRHILKVHDPLKQANKIKTNTFQCQLCPKKYSSKNKLVEHRYKKHNVARKGGPLFHCNECDFSHVSESRVRAHFTLKHTTENRFKCNDCPTSFKSGSGLIKHMKLVHTGNSSVQAQAISQSAPMIVVTQKSAFPSQALGLSHSLSNQSGYKQLPAQVGGMEGGQGQSSQGQGLFSMEIPTQGHRVPEGFVSQSSSCLSVADNYHSENISDKNTTPPVVPYVNDPIGAMNRPWDYELENNDFLYNLNLNMPRSIVTEAGMTYQNL